MDALIVKLTFPITFLFLIYLYDKIETFKNRYYLLKYFNLNKSMVWIKRK